MHLIQRALPRTLVRAKPCCSSLGSCRTLLRPGRGTATRVGGGQRSAPPRRLMPTELQAQHRLRQRGRFRRQAQGRLPLRLLQGAVFRQARGGAPVGVPPSVQLQSTSCPAGMCLLDAAAKAFPAASISATPLAAFGKCLPSSHVCLMLLLGLSQQQASQQIPRLVQTLPPRQAHVSFILLLRHSQHQALHQPPGRFSHLLHSRHMPSRCCS